MESPHLTVLKEEAVEALMASQASTQPRLYVDGTFGRGGHSAAIIGRLASGDRLVAFDKDPDAADTAQLMSSSHGCFTFIRDSFANLDRAGTELAGVLLDLGVSSPQIDDPARGFSFQHDGPLDMRMDNTSGATAADFVNTAPEGELARVLRDYGEERFARRIATALVERRRQCSFESTGDLAAVVAKANPAWEKHKHPATRAFQALRIQVNRELADLEALLSKVIELLAIGGRLVVISFHSLEDRLVKRFISRESRGAPVPRGVPIRDQERGQRLRKIGKAQRASDQEVRRNPRARSAIMRVAERVA